LLNSQGTKRNVPKLAFEGLGLFVPQTLAADARAVAALIGDTL